MQAGGRSVFKETGLLEISSIFEARPHILAGPTHLALWTPLGAALLLHLGSSSNIDL